MGSFLLCLREAIGIGRMAARKRRTREHIIADMSLHHLAYLVVKAGFTFESTRTDYGYDGTIVTFSPNGEVDNGIIYVQLKATDSIRIHGSSPSVLFRISKKDLDLWGSEPFPVYLVLFDAQMEIAYWLYLQNYIESNNITVRSIKSKSLEVRIAMNQSLSLASLEAWRVDKTRVLTEIGVVPHA